MTCTIRGVRTTALRKHYLPEEVTGYCAQCPRSGRNWSCPPHGFDTEEYVDRYRTAYVIGAKIPMQPGMPQDDAMKRYHEQRTEFNRRLIAYESELQDGVALIAGHCTECEPCTRQDGNACRHPERIRHSLESLGYKVSTVVEELFEDTLQWPGQGMPEYLYIVAGMLTNGEVDTKGLRRKICIRI